MLDKVAITEYNNGKVIHKYGEIDFLEHLDNLLDVGTHLSEIGRPFSTGIAAKIGVLSSERQPLRGIDLYVYSPLFNLLEKRFPEPEGKKVLELGCLTGDFLHVLQLYGYDSSGIEPRSTEAYLGNMSFLKTEGRAGVIRCGYAEQILPGIDTKFDAIISLNVMVKDTISQAQLRTILDESFKKSPYQLHVSTKPGNLHSANNFVRDGNLVRHSVYPNESEVIEIFKS
jgi:hypothetical protein